MEEKNVYINVELSEEGRLNIKTNMDKRLSLTVLMQAILTISDQVVESKEENDSHE